MKRMRHIFTFLAFIVLSTHAFGQKTISYSYDSAGNRTGRNASESSIASQTAELQNFQPAENLNNISVKARDNEVFALNHTFAADFATAVNADRTVSLTATRRDNGFPKHLPGSKNAYFPAFSMFPKRLEEK